MPAPAGHDAEADEALFISEVFHSLSQPLTALHCTLDLALQRDETFEHLRASVQAALEHAERLRRGLLLVRALNDAATPGDTVEAIDLCALLRELRESMSPLFESAGRTLDIELPCSPVMVRADEVRLTRALFVFVEYLFRYMVQGGALSIVTDRNSAHVDVRITSASSLPVSPAMGGSDENRSCEVELMRRTIAASGGEFIRLDHTVGRSVWRARLPLA